MRQNASLTPYSPLRARPARTGTREAGTLPVLRWKSPSSSSRRRASLVKGMRPRAPRSTAPSPSRAAAASRRRAYRRSQAASALPLDALFKQSSRLALASILESEGRALSGQAGSAHLSRALRRLAWASSPASFSEARRARAHSRRSARRRARRAAMCSGGASRSNRRLS